MFGELGHYGFKQKQIQGKVFTNVRLNKCLWRGKINFQSPTNGGKGTCCGEGGIAEINLTEMLPL
jgi:hypothetical protein